MFFFIGLVWIALGSIPLIRALLLLRSRSFQEIRGKVIRGIIFLALFILVLIVISVFFAIYTDYLWFQSLGFEDRYTTEIKAKLLLFFAGAIIAFLISFFLTGYTFRFVRFPLKRFSQTVISLVISVIMAIWSLGAWRVFLQFRQQFVSETVDPIFSKSISYYLFSLPFYSQLISWLAFLFTVLLGIQILLVVRANQRSVQAESGEEGTGSVNLQNIRRPILLPLIALAILLAFNARINVFRLMLSSEGVVQGAGWLAVNVRTPVLYISMATFFVIALLFAISFFSKSFMWKLFALRSDEESGNLPITGKSLIAPAVFAAFLIIISSVVPGLFRSLVLNPNEITLERPYLEHNIEFTQDAFAVNGDNVQEQQVSVGFDITPEITDRNEATLNNVRLWDWRALRENLKQQQEIRLYYEFNDVDIDRYRLNGEYREVMLSVRELNKGELAPSSQTWVSRHLKYTHGYGLVLTPVHDFLPQGRPDLYIKNIPPVVEQTDLEINRPEIYYGELTTDHVYVRTDQREFDYPSGDENIYTSYEGTGGVRMGTLFRRIAYAWKYDSHNQLFSGYFKPESRILFNREIRNRVNTIAPFLLYDQDPYPVITEDGRIVFILDGYTATSYYPYSQPYRGSLAQFSGANYMRNSVKAVVDAYDGTVTLYAMNSEDPILQTFRNIYPGIVVPFEEMPEYLKQHIRYPADFLTVQADIYSNYHMENPDVFYQREDVWQFATERYRQNFQTVLPYYVMVNFPGSGNIEFVLITPFTPKNKNVINAWMAGRSDMPNYGELIVYTFPKGVEVLGPRQIEARIDQDAEMSQKLSLWSQRGSEVIRGNLLAIPLFGEEDLFILFAEPIYLQAEDAALPEVKRIVLADQEHVVWAETFETALDRIIGLKTRIGQDEAVQVTEGAEEMRAAAAGPGLEGVPQGALQSALEAFNGFMQSLGDRDFARAGNQLNQLQDAMQQLQEQQEQQGGGQQ